MKNSIFLFVILVLCYPTLVKSQQHSDAVIIGHVVSKGEHIPFVNIYLENTTMGTATDITGHYMLVDVPVGKFTIVAKMVGYKIQKK